MVSQMLNPAYYQELFHPIVNSFVNIERTGEESDKHSSRNGSIKLTIKNRSKVILNCDYEDSPQNEIKEYCEIIKSDNTHNAERLNEILQELERHKRFTRLIPESLKVKESNEVKNSLLSNKQSVQIVQTIHTKAKKKPFDEELNEGEKFVVKNEEQSHKKRKLSLQEYKLEKAMSSNGSNKASPVPMLPEITTPSLDNGAKCQQEKSNSTDFLNTTNKINEDDKLDDPIREAWLRILNRKKQKAAAIRKRDENIVMTKTTNIVDPRLQRFAEEFKKGVDVVIEKEKRPMLLKKINFQQYTLRKGDRSSSSSVEVSPEALFPEMSRPNLHKAATLAKPEDTKTGSSAARKRN